MDGRAERSDDMARRILARHEELRQIHASRDTELQQVCDYMFPRRDFSLTREKGAVRTRRLFDTAGMIAHEKVTSVLYGYMLSPHTPWVEPELAGRDPKSYEEEKWFHHVRMRMHKFYSRASGTFRTTMAEDLMDLTGLGSSVHWQKNTPRGPIYLALPVAQNYWAENEDGVIDENHRRYPMTLRRAFDRWPDSPGLKQKMTDTKRPEAEDVEIIHAVEPRENGRAGAVRDRKPFRDISVLVDKSEVLEVGGHDRFPYNIGRFQKRSGSPVGEGLGWRNLPMVKLAAMVSEAMIRATEKAADPVLWTMLPRGTPIDRRPGQVNHFNQLLAMGMRDAGALIQKLEEGGDMTVAYNLLQYIHQRIDQGFYVDWLTPHEGPVETATGVMDRRDIRLRTMGPIVARTEHEKLNLNVENTFEDLQAVDHFDPPPASLDNEEIIFGFSGPMATALKQGESESILRTIETGAALTELDPDTALVFEGAKMLREAGEAYGLRPELLASPKVYEEKREAQRQTGEMTEEMAAAQAAAQALRDGGQGMAALQGAANEAA